MLTCKSFYDWTRWCPLLRITSEDFRCAYEQLGALLCNLDRKHLEALGQVSRRLVALDSGERFVQGV